jgi:hypothetical protein
MAYERYGTRDTPRDERSRWRDESFEGRGRGREDRGFFERAGDEVASWFGDEEAERRRREDQRMSDPDRSSGRNWWGDEHRGRSYGSGRDWDRGASEREDVGQRASRWTGRDFDHEHERGHWPTGERERSYRPMTGDYGRAQHESGQFFAASGYGRDDLERERQDFGRERGWREREPYGRNEDYRRDRFIGSGPREFDPEYQSWRRQHMSDLDRDYDEYRRENQARFESEFGSWRERRQLKRGLLGQIREHMEVVGVDDQHVGTVDRVAGDRIILTKSDPESGGAHHSLSCSDIDRVEGDRVILAVNADEARQRWRDESRSRALFEREDQGEMGPRSLDRSFEGTYR